MRKVTPTFFHSQRVIHRDELESQPNAEVVLDGDDPWELAPGFFAISKPGYTKGHCVLLYHIQFPCYLCQLEPIFERHSLPTLTPVIIASVERVGLIDRICQITC
jgi:hypothetical protein